MRLGRDPLTLDYTVPSYSRLFLEALALVFVTHCVASPYLEFLKRKCCWSEERTCRPFQSNACLRRNCSETLNEAASFEGDRQEQHGSMPTGPSWSSSRKEMKPSMCLRAPRKARSWRPHSNFWDASFWDKHRIGRIYKSALSTENTLSSKTRDTGRDRRRHADMVLFVARRTRVVHTRESYSQ